MFIYLLEIFLGIISGLFLGSTGINPIAIILVTLDLLKIGDYKTNVGTILLVNLFPITIGSFYEFYKLKKINYTLGLLLIITMTIGSYFGSILVTKPKYAISNNMIKLITGYFSIIIGIVFLIAAYYDNT
jgi:uncharacterized membrane protein YfcA